MEINCLPMTVSYADISLYHLFQAISLLFLCWYQIIPEYSLIDHFQFLIQNFILFIILLSPSAFIRSSKFFNLNFFQFKYLNLIPAPTSSLYFLHEFLSLYNLFPLYKFIKFLSFINLLILFPVD